MNLSLRRTQRGVSLIELMLALAIIAIILVIATRYFARANLSQQVSNATDQVMGVRAAANSYLNDQKTANTLTIATLVAAGYLPKGYGGTDGSGAGGNPWNGNITIGYGSTGAGTGTLATRSFTIGLTNIPVGACGPLEQKLDQNMNSTLGESVTTAKACESAGTMSATYSR